MPALRSPLRPAIRSALRSPLDPAISSGGAFSPLSLFTGGELGLWFDPSDIATLYQDSAATTPVTAVTQPDGLILDKRLGLVRGAELITGGAGPTSTASWATAGATQSIVSGELEIINTSAGVGRSDGSFTCVAGKLYELVGVVRSGAANAVAQSARVVLTINGVGLTQVIVDTNGVAKPFAFKFFAASATTPEISLQIASDGAAGALGDKAYLSGCSIKEIPGNHALQATSAARPTYSARVNLLEKTEEFSDSIWTKQAGVTVTDNAVTAPNGSLIGIQVDWAAASTGAGVFQAGIPKPAYAPNIKSIYVRADSVGGTVGATDPNNGLATTTISLTTGWQLLTLTETTEYTVIGLWIRKTASSPNRIYLAQPQLELGSVATRYQQVNTATDYDTVGFPVYDSFDGVDDALATGAITLSADMDCFIAVRRNSATGALAYTTPGSGVYLGAMDATAGVTSAGAGTPTYVANGVAVPGGTSTTRTQLATAVPAGSWVVLEIRNANLSAWTAFASGAYTGLILGANIGGIILAPAQSTASRNQIRTYLGAKVGLTL